MLYSTVLLAGVAASSAGDSARYNPETHTPIKSSGCGSPSPYAAGKTTRVKGKYGGVKYIYRVYVPKSYHKNTPVPLVTQHNGWGVSAAEEEKGSGITIYAEKYGWIAVFPQGSDDNTHNGGPWYSWNAVGTTRSPGPVSPTCTNATSAPSNCYTSCGSCTDSPQCWWTTCHNDVTPTGTGTSHVTGIVPSLYDTLESQFCIDTTREYAAGESNGGMMTFQLGVDMASRLAAVVPQFGSFHYQFAESPKHGVPILSFHGTKDTCVPANNSAGYPYPIGLGYYYTNVHDIFYGSAYSAGWRTSNQCSGPSSQYKTSYDGQYGLYCWDAGTCSGGDVVRCAWNGDHNWYGCTGPYDGNPKCNPSANGGLVTEFMMKWTKPGHIGFGRVQGEELGEGNLLEDITIIEDEEEESHPVEDLPAVLSVDRRLHYGNPADGCLEDEHIVELAGGRACMPKISSDVDANGLPAPRCKIGWPNAGKGNGCPTDAPVPHGSKSLPVCLDKGNTTDPYVNAEFHCALACPCAILDSNGVCAAESHTHCPPQSFCVLGELRFRGRGVCTYALLPTRVLV